MQYLYTEYSVQDICWRITYEEPIKNHNNINHNINKNLHLQCVFIDNIYLKNGGQKKLFFKKLKILHFLCYFVNISNKMNEVVKLNHSKAQTFHTIMYWYGSLETV